MDNPKSPSEKVQDKRLPAAADEGKIDVVTIDTDGSHEQQLSVKTATHSFLKLIPEVSVEANKSVTDTPEQTSAKPTDPVIQLRVQRAGTSRDELDAEALELMEIVRDCVLKTSELTGLLAGHPDVIAPYRNEISMLDATAAFLTTMLGPNANGITRKFNEQTLRRTEIRNRCYRAINQMRRIPVELKEGDGSGQGGPGSVLKGRAAHLASNKKINQEKIDKRLAVNVGGNRPKIDKRGANPLARSFSGVLKFQLDGAGQEGSGSTEEEQDEQEVDGSDQGGSRPCQGNRMEEID